MFATTANLPFVRGPLLWVTQPTGVWGEDNLTGRGYADALADLGEPSLLYFVVQAMGPPAQWSGVEVGFFHRLAERAGG